VKVAKPVAIGPLLASALKAAERGKRYAKEGMARLYEQRLAWARSDRANDNNPAQKMKAVQ
jgi:hypothetical protein